MDDDLTTDAGGEDAAIDGNEKLGGMPSAESALSLVAQSSGDGYLDEDDPVNQDDDDDVGDSDGNDGEEYSGDDEEYEEEYDSTDEFLWETHFGALSRSVNSDAVLDGSNLEAMLAHHTLENNTPRSINSAVNQSSSSSASATVYPTRIRHAAQEYDERYMLGEGEMLQTSDEE